MESKTNFRPYVIKSRLKEVKHGLKLPVPVNSIEVKYSSSSGGIEYYDYYDSIDKAIEYIEYLENKITELEVRNQIENAIWQETVSKCFKETIQINLEKTLNEKDEEN
jgi:hypothetical protein